MRLGPPFGPPPWDFHQPANLEVGSLSARPAATAGLRVANAVHACSNLGAASKLLIRE